MTASEERALAAARSRAVDSLAGRTVWCASHSLGERLGAAGDELAVETLPLAAAEPLRRLAERIDAVLAGASPSPSGRTFAADDRALWDDGLRDAEARLGGAVRRDDVVVLHDALTALLAEAAREHGAHVIWHMEIALAGGDAAGAAWSLLGPCTCAIDAYATSWTAPSEGVSAVVPSAGRFADGHDLGWAGVLADVVAADRGDTVGGTVHARPAVAAR
jgi:hypothetical protein